MFPYLVADIGGTNARFALITEKKGDEFKMEHIQILKGADFSSFEAAMQHYLDGLGGVKPTAACVAIAGPISGDRVRMTNLPWGFSQEGLRAQFELDAFLAINDYTALAVATSRLPSGGLKNVLNGDRNPVGNKAILGPGTGLGVAGLARAGDGWLPIPSEGGHVTMAPATAFEADILKAAMARHGHVSAEVCLSGPGLVNLYHAVCDVQGVAAEALKPQDVSGQGLAGSNAQCKEALDLFCAFMGTVSSNLVLTYGASGGVYITGGIIPRFVEYFRSSPFEARFREKGIMSHYVADVPVDVVSYEQTAFLGAAAWLYQNVK